MRMPIAKSNMSASGSACVKTPQSLLFPKRVDDYIGEDNSVRVIDVFVDVLDLGALGFESVEPALTGRPRYHPATLLKIYIYGYLNRVPSSRRLERETQRNIDAMRRTPDQQLSMTDSDARSMATHGRGSGMVGYNVQMAVEAANHLIVAHEVTNEGHDRHRLASTADAAKTAMVCDEIAAHNFAFSHSLGRKQTLNHVRSPTGLDLTNHR